MSVVKRDYFPKTLNLAEYAKLIAQCELVRNSDNASYRQFCLDCLVICETSPPLGLTCDLQRGLTVREVLNRVVENDLRCMSSLESRLKHSYKERNVLSLGYRSKRWHSELEVKDSMGIECYFVNTLHTFFMDRNWELVLSRLGDRALQHVLSRPVLLIVDSSYVQIAGQAMFHCLQYHQRNLKRSNVVETPATCSPVSKTRSLRKTFFSQPLPRHCMFYNARCSRPGLPRQHLFNKTSTTPDSLVKDMISCFATLCACGGYDYQRTKKQKVAKNMAFSRSSTAAEGDGAQHVAEDVDLLSMGSQQRGLLLQLAASVLSGHKACNIPFLLDHHCPLQQSTLPGAMSSSAGAGARAGARAPGTSETKFKKTKRGRRAGCRVRQRSQGTDLCATTPAPVAPVAPVAAATDGAATDGAASVYQHQEGTKIDDAAPVSKKSRRNCIDKSDRSVRHHSVGHRLVEKAWRNGKLDLQIEKQGLQSQEPDDCLFNSGTSDVFDCGDVDVEVDVSAETLGDFKRRAQAGEGLQHHIRMRTMATVASDPADWISSGDSTAAHAASSSSDEEINKLQSNRDNDGSNEMHKKTSVSGQRSHCCDKATECNEREAPAVNHFDRACAVEKVTEFVQAVCRRLFPRIGVWSSAHAGCTRLNSNLFMKRIQEFVSLGRWEGLNVTRLSEGMKCSMMPWLVAGKQWTSTESFGTTRPSTEVQSQENSGGSSTSHDKRKVNNNNKRKWNSKPPTLCSINDPNIPSSSSLPEGERDSDHVVLCVFLAWVFTEIIPPLLANCFYVTEGEGTGSRVLYYRKQEWEVLRAIGEAQMGSHFVKVAVNCHGIAGSSRDAPVSGAGAGAAGPRGGKGTSGSALAMYPCVRFVPKKTSMRAITNMKSVPHSTMAVFNIPQRLAVPEGGGIVHSNSNINNSNGNFISPLPHTLTNASLYNVLHVLRHFHERYSPSACGFGASGVEEACERFKSYQSFHANKMKDRAVDDDELPSSRTEQAYYVAVLDIDKCFDTMDTARLYDVVEQLVMGHLPASSQGSSIINRDVNRLSTVSTHTSPPTPSTTLPDELLIHRYSVAMYLPSAERFVSRSVRQVTGADDFNSFQKSSLSLARTYHNAIITDGVVYPSISRDELLKILRQHLFQHAVRLPEQSRRKRGAEASERDLLHTQVRGIPQGSALSPLLCNLYYGHVEKDTFGSREEMEALGLTDMSSLIVRVMDDYLMISTRKDAVAHFLQRAHTCFKPFGGGFNPAKTKVNFDVTLDIDGAQVSLPRMSGSSVTWCGFSINHATLEVSPSFTKLLSIGLQHSMTRDCCQAGVAFRKALKGFIRPKIQSIILDSSVNRFATVTTSVYLVFFSAALRCDVYLRLGAKSLRLSPICRNFGFIFCCIHDLINYGARLVLVRGRRRANLIATSPVGVSSAERGSTLYAAHRGKSSHESGVTESDERGSVAHHCPQLCSLSFNQTKWLGLHAFLSALSRRPSMYAPVLKSLRAEIARSENNLSPSERHIATDYLSSFEVCVRDLLPAD